MDREDEEERLGEDGIVTGTIYDSQEPPHSKCSCGTCAEWRRRHMANGFFQRVAEVFVPKPAREPVVCGAPFTDEDLSTMQVALERLAHQDMAFAEQELARWAKKNRPELYSRYEQACREVRREPVK